MSTRSLSSSPLSLSPPPSTAVSPASAFLSSSSSLSERERAPLRSRRHRFEPEQSAWIRSQLRGLSPHGKSWRRLFAAFRSAFPEDRTTTLEQYKSHAKYHARRRERRRQQQQQQCGGSQKLRRLHGGNEDDEDHGQEEEDGGDEEEEEEEDDDGRDHSRRRRSLVESLRGPEIRHWKRPRDAALVDTTVDEFEVRIKCDAGDAATRLPRTRPPPLRIAKRTPVTSPSPSTALSAVASRPAADSKRICNAVKNESFLEWLLEHRAADASREKLEPTPAPTPTRAREAVGRRRSDASAETEGTERLLMNTEDLRGRLVQQEEKAHAARLSAEQWKRLCADAEKDLKVLQSQSDSTNARLSALGARIRRCRAAQLPTAVPATSATSAAAEPALSSRSSTTSHERRQPVIHTIRLRVDVAQDGSSVQVSQPF